MSAVDTSEISTSIRNAVHHLKQLGESLESNTINDIDLNNIDHVADTLMALEKEILKLYVDYETESIESSRLRHRLKLLPNSIKNEIQTAVNMARESNVSVIQKLQKELDTLLERVRAYTDQDKELTVAINSLQAEKSALQQQYDSTITDVNHRVCDKATLQITLNETRDAVRETNQHTFDLEEDIMALKESLMQERNEARQEKVRLEDEIVTTSKRYDEQEQANDLLKRDVDAATHKVSETELQLRTMYRVELQFTELCAVALLDFQTKKESLEKRAAMAHERTNEETDRLKSLKQKHEEVVKHIEERVQISKILEHSKSETGKELEEIKHDIATKLEKTAKLNLDNAETTKELDSMREAHQMMIDSLKLQLATLEKELQHIRQTRISKQKERETLLKTIEQTKLTSRNNDIRHNRFVAQTTAKVTDLSERKSILDRNAREDQMQMNQLGQRLSDLKNEYQQMKTQFEQQIKILEEATAQLLIVIDTNRKKISQNTPEFQHLKEAHEKMTSVYEAAKETMIETKRKKHETQEKIANVQRSIREKNKSRDITMLAVRECQSDTKQRMEKAHEDMLKLEEEIYEKGCRLETLEDENERFQETIDYLNHQIELFNRFSQQSSVDIKNLDDNNHGLINILESGWGDDRQLEHEAAQQDLKYIDDLTVLLQHTEKRKAKVGTIVYRLVGELQHLKYYLEGMSNPSTPPLLSNPTPDHPLQTASSGRRSRRRRSLEEEQRAQSAIIPPITPIDPAKSRRRPQSVIRGEISAPTPIQLRPDIQQRVSDFVEENFHLKSASSKKAIKTSKTGYSSGQQSERTDLSSWQSGLTSKPNPSDENDRRKTTNNPRVAFA
ncbi:unnamed protein product [Rotaria magnacalcarata]|uniref:Uncharacterized protein n=7 Tax=Rotaria magnacalcarata TaxID=392030 RepID=A0A816QW99_9BILA|nr:unnamed protein product [Rotaria magnacalcarata]